MLAELDITNFAIIEHLHLRLASGFNVLTGETGAGKSIIVDAVSTLLGGRVGSEVIRSGAEQARIEGVFFPNAEISHEIEPILAEYDLGVEDTIVLSREINREGRNVCRINGRAVPLKALQAVGEVLIDIHGQSEHLSLMRVREHLEFLDRYANLGELRAQIAAQVKTLRGVRQELESLRRDERELARRVDLLQYQVKEIATAKLRIGEEEELAQERKMLANAEKLTKMADAACDALRSSGEEGKAAIEWVSEAARSLASLEKIDPSLSVHRAAAQEIVDRLDDLARTIRAYRDGIDFNPVRLQEVEDRLDLIHTLKRKYGDSIQAVLDYAVEAQRELDGITHSEERIAELHQEEEKLLIEIGQLAARLSVARHEASERLSKEIERELADLYMKKARFAVDLTRSEAADGVPVDGQRCAFDATGIDRVEFLISPNPGEPPKPMAKIASGGETSRLMLAMKAVLTAADRIPTLIFDEIDSGIGGRAGGVVGRKLWGLTGEHQVLCVTHLPQLACYGDVHFHVHKEVIGGRTVTQVQELNEATRLEELAAMVGSATEATRRSAREMLEQMREWKAKARKGIAKD